MLKPPSMTGRVPALILGGGHTALGVARSLVAHQVECFLLGRQGDYARKSRLIRAIDLDVGSTRESVNLASLLSEVPLDRAVLFPCSDNWVAATAGLPEALSDRFPASVPPLDSAMAFTDKGTFAERLEKLGVPQPQTIEVKDVETLDLLTDEQLGSFFIKPADSQMFSKRYRAKAFSITSRSQAESLVARLIRDDMAILLQEMIPGSVTDQYEVDGVVDRGGAVAAFMVRRRVRMWPTDFGNTTSAVSVPVDEVKPALDALFRVIDAFDHRGLFDAEFKWDARDQTFKMLELNARPWWQIELATLCGMNLCAMAYDDALGHAVGPQADYEIGRRFSLLPLDFRVFLNQRRAGRLSLSAWLRSLRGTTDGMLRLDDPLPVLRFVANYAERMIRGLMSRRSGDASS